MSQEEFNKIFLHELSDLYSAEEQIVEELPNMIKAASNEELKEVLKSHLQASKMQIKRLEQIFLLLDAKPSKKVCMGIKGILKEGSNFISEFSKSNSRDAALISAAQKVEHYEIASYGSAYSHADYLGCDREIKNLLNDTLTEEKDANKKLSKLAEGSIFSAGINKLACKS